MRGLWADTEQPLEAQSWDHGTPRGRAQLQAPPPSLGLSPSWAAHGCSVKGNLMCTLCRENPLLICELRFP